MKFSNLWFELCAARREAGEQPEKLEKFIQAHKDFIFAVTQAGLTFKAKKDDPSPYQKGYVLSNDEEYNWDEPL